MKPPNEKAAPAQGGETNGSADIIATPLDPVNRESGSESGDLRDAMLAALAAGVSIIPIDHTTKRPAMQCLPRDPVTGKPTWKPFMKRLATQEEVEAWVRAGVRAFAVVGGAVSGGLEVLDFDVERYCEQWCDQVGELRDSLPFQRTGSGCFQVMYRAPDRPGNTELAHHPNDDYDDGREIAIETRGEGGYAVVPPSVYPTGTRYEWVSGSLESIPTISLARADALKAAAVKLDQAPHTRQQLEAAKAAPERVRERKDRAKLNSGVSVINAFNDAHNVRDILRSHGYSDRGNRMIRPNPEPLSAPGVTILIGGNGRAVSYHHSTNDPLHGPYCCDAFDVYCRLSHGGDVKKAVQVAAEQLGLNGSKRGGAPPKRDAQNADQDSVGDGNGNETPGDDAADGGFSTVTTESDADALQYEPFPIEVIPATARKYIEESAAALGCDCAYVALPLFSAAAGAIGNTRSIRLKMTWHEPAVIWTAVVGRSGTVKSPAFDAAMQFTRARQRKLIKEHAKAIKAWKEEFREWKKNGQGVPEPERPKPLQRLHCHDITVEALADRLEATERGTLVAVDELAGFLCSFNAYKKGGGDVEHYLSMHRAGNLKVDRKTGDKTTIYVPAAAVSITGTIQPKALARVLTEQFFANGLAARFLVAKPPPEPKKWNDLIVSEQTSTEMAGIFTKLLHLKSDLDAEHDPVPKPLPLTPEAQVVFIEFYNTHNAALLEIDDERLAAMSAKLEGYAARLALVLQLIADPLASCVTVEHMEAGIKLARWFGREAQRVYAGMNSAADADQDELVELIQSLGGEVTPAELAHRKRKYRSPGAAEAVLQRLVDLKLGAWKFFAPAPGGGPSKRVFRLAE